MKILFKLILILSNSGNYSTENHIDTESMFIVTSSCIVLENPNRKKTETFHKENIINNINKKNNKPVIKSEEGQISNKKNS